MHGNVRYGIDMCLGIYGITWGTFVRDRVGGCETFGIVMIMKKYIVPVHINYNMPMKNNYWLSETFFILLI